MNFKKGVPKKLSEHFDSMEFDCHCPCSGPTEIDLELVRRLELVHDLAGKPIYIDSGFRCPNKQLELKESGKLTAVGISTHELGRAADIRVRGLSGLELEELARAAGFKAVGVAATWVHVDLRDDKDRRWTY